MSCAPAPPSSTETASQEAVEKYLNAEAPTQVDSAGGVKAEEGWPWLLLLRMVWSLGRTGVPASATSESSFFHSLESKTVAAQSHTHTHTMQKLNKLDNNRLPSQALRLQPRENHSLSLEAVLLPRMGAGIRCPLPQSLSSVEML